jgi:hypothetical protein
MKSLDLGRYALCSSVAAAILAGCGGSQPSSWSSGAIPHGANSSFNSRTMQFVPSTAKSPPPGVKTPDYNLSGPLLYVTNFDSPPYDGVTIYDARQDNPSPIAVINADISEPGGDCIDGEGTLYVANDGSGSGWISEYALGKTKPLRVITKGISSPAFCAIDGNGNLWVTNIDGPVTEYLRGSTAPHFTISKGLTYPDGIALDRQGNIYVGNLNAPTGVSNVKEYPPGRESPSRTITDGVAWPVGIAVDAKGTLYVTNDVSPCNIEEYRAGQSHPYEEITQDIDGPTAMTFAQNGRMYEVNEGGCSGSGPASVILEFRWHSLAPSKRMVSKDLYTPFGAAYYPPLIP